MASSSLQFAKAARRVGQGVGLEAELAGVAKWALWPLAAMPACNTWKANRNPWIHYNSYSCCGSGTAVAAAPANAAVVAIPAPYSIELPISIVEQRRTP